MRSPQIVVDNTTTTNLSWALFEPLKKKEKIMLIVLCTTVGLSFLYIMYGRANLVSIIMCDICAMVMNIFAFLIARAMKDDCKKAILSIKEMDT